MLEVGRGEGGGGGQLRICLFQYFQMSDIWFAYYNATTYIQHFQVVLRTSQNNYTQHQLN
jgi:hypothetical protein